MAWSETALLDGSISRVPHFLVFFFVKEKEIAFFPPFRIIPSLARAHARVCVREDEAFWVRRNFSPVKEEKNSFGAVKKINVSVTFELIVNVQLQIVEMKHAIPSFQKKKKKRKKNRHLQWEFFSAKQRGPCLSNRRKMQRGRWEIERENPPPPSSSREFLRLGERGRGGLLCQRSY